MRAMALRSALVGSAMTVGLIAALGNPPVVDLATEDEASALGSTLVRFPNWDVFDLPSEAVVQTALRLGVTVVAVGLLCALVGRTASRGASFLAGWAALVVAAALGGAVNYVYLVAVVLDGRTFGTGYLDGLVIEVNSAAAFGLWTGWVVGALLAITAPAPARAPAPAAAPWGAPAPAPAARNYSEPPPPWWAPTRVDDRGTVVEPGPSVFPPGGLPHSPPAPPASAAPPPPPAPRPDAAQEMTTASGDPHPSDPDATQAIGGPPRDDPEATTTMESANPDQTLPIPRQPE
jgi:hypothetical protein